MSTRTRNTNRVQTPATVEFKSKSEHVRALLNGGTSVADAAREVGIGYAFAYGIAKRAGLAEVRAARRQPKGSKFAALVKFMAPTADDALVADIVTAFGRGAASPVKPVILHRVPKAKAPKATPAA